MAVIRISSYGDHFTPEKLKEWPDPEAVSLMEVLAREDIDKAVHAILLRENYVVKKLDTYFQHLDISKERRKEVLHKKWVTNVAEPLQERIMDKVMSYGRIKKRKQRNFDYLQHTNKTVFIPPLCDPLFQRQREVAEESRDILQCETGAKYSMKEFLDIEKARLHSSLPPFTFTLHTVVPKETWKPPARDQRSKIPNPCSGIIEPSLCQLAQKNKCDKMIYHKCYARLQPSAFNAIRSVSTPTTRVPRRRPEKLTCVENEHLCNKERKATDLSQIAFKRQFHFSKLKQENKNDKKGHQMVLEARKHRPKSWTAGESLHQEGLQTLERKVMTAEVLANHLASMRVGDRQGSYKLYHL